MKSITSAANADFKHWRRLADSARYMKAQRCTLAEGLHLAQVVIERAHRVLGVLVRRGASGASLETVLRGFSGVPQYELAPALYDALAPVEHGVGLTLLVEIPVPAEPPAGGDVVYLETVQDPGNVGALARVAAGAGVGTVLAGPGTAALWSPRALRAGQGAQLALRWADDVALDALDAWCAGPWIGADVRDAGTLWDLDLPAGPVGWMFGAEGAGLSAAARARCSHRVRIPLTPAVESLNVATAAAVCLFERQRRRAAG